MTLRGVFLACAVSSLLTNTGCRRTASVSRTAYIIGPNNILPSDAPEARPAKPDVRNAAVLIATRLKSGSVKFCSGTLIGAEVSGEPYRVLTNHHCFAVPGDDGKATRKVLVEGCTNTTAYFAFTGDTQNTPMRACKAGSLRTNFDGDLAVFTLDENPPERYKPLQISREAEIAKDTEALIVHYPDVPERAAIPPGQKVKLPTMSVTVEDCKVIGNFEVGEWPLDRTLPFSMRHSCDLIHGSSGSGLIDRKNSKLIGVNWGGIKISYADDIRTDNVATKASYVVSFLDRSVDEQVATAKSTVTAHQRSADAAEKQEDSDEFHEKAKKSVCGVVGFPDSWPGSAIIFLIPFAFLIYREVALWR